MEHQQRTVERTEVGTKFPSPLAPGARSVRTQAVPPVIQRSAALEAARPRRALTLSLERLNPVIRIAHRITGPLHIPPRLIFDYEFVLFLRGHGVIGYRRGREIFEPNQLFLLAPFVSHRFDSRDDSPCEHLAVHFDFAPGLVPGGERLDRRSAYEVVLEGGLALPRSVKLAALDPVRAMFTHLVEAYARGEALARLEARLLLLRILHQLLSSRRAPQPQTPDPVLQLKINRALLFLDTHLAEKLSAAALAAAAGFSRVHFNRVFRSWTGFSPMEYLRRRRIAKAKELLLDVDRPIKQIARQLGFTDVFHFSRTFRKIDGLPPTQYRRAALAGRIPAPP